jgi:aryl-alcohol dehydrogenase-like predicted oxidoreductase
LEYRRLGESDVEVSAVGLGTAPFGGTDWSNTWGPQDDRVSIATIHRAVELGINWLDTAPIYGQGHAEEVVGRALRELPASERPLVFTKCGLQWAEGTVGASRRTLSPARVRQELQSSLRRLGLERIDLYQIHYPPAHDSAPLEECWAELAALVAEGYVRSIGVCNFTVQELERCEVVRHVDSDQVPFSLLKPEVRADLIPWCRDHGSGVLAYRALASGLLTDAFSLARARQLEPSDWRVRDLEFQSPALESNLAVRDALKRIAGRLNASVAEVAVAWALACTGVSGVIVGAKSPGQVDGWVEAGSLRVEPEEWEAAEAVRRAELGL